MKTLFLIVGASLGLNLSAVIAAEHDPVKMKAGHGMYLVEQAIITGLDAFEVQALGSLGMVPSLDPLHGRLFVSQLQNAAGLISAVESAPGPIPTAEPTKQLIIAAREYLSLLQSPGESGIFNVHQFRVQINRGLKAILQGRMLLKLQSMGSPGPLQNLSIQEARAQIEHGAKLMGDAEALYPIVKKESDDPYNAELLKRALVLKQKLLQ